MAIALHVSGILLAVLGTVVSLRVYGRRPRLQRVVLGLGIAVLMTIVLLALTTVLDPETSSTRLPLLFLLSAWLLLSCLQPARSAVLSSIALFAYSLVLSFQYLSLATSARYTGNPPWRLRRVAMLRRSRISHGQTIPASVMIYPTWHTWLTGLYEIQRRAPGC